MGSSLSSYEDASSPSSAKSAANGTYIHTGYTPRDPSPPRPSSPRSPTSQQHKHSPRPHAKNNPLSPTLEAMTDPSVVPDMPAHFPKMPAAPMMTPPRVKVPPLRLARGGAPERPRVTLEQSEE